MCGCKYCVYILRDGVRQQRERDGERGERGREERKKGEGKLLFLRDLRLFAVQKICLQLVKGTFAK